jgi:predicted nucleic acid-binding protein
MKRVFADTSYWIALINSADGLHRTAKDATISLRNTEIVSSDSVLIEFLNFFSAHGMQMRDTAYQVVSRIMSDPKITVIEQTRQRFHNGFMLYAARLDKGYSLTDCISMEIMREYRISHCLTGDRHFTQEGFVQML